MKRILLGLFLLPFILQAQFCDVQGNVAIFTNYDGGILNIDVDVYIPNLKIGVRSYEAVEINLSGTYVDSVTEVYYTGYDSDNDNCNMGVLATSINGASQNTTTTVGPYVSLGSHSSCGTSTTSENHFMSIFGSGSSMLSHTMQYGCWSSTPYKISSGGTCCAGSTAPATPLTVVYSESEDASCNGTCDGVGELTTVLGGTPPYSYSWSSGNSTTNSANGLCAGTVTVTVSDNGGGAAVENLTVSEPSAITATPTVSDVSCFGGDDGTASLSITGGTPTYTEDWGQEDPNNLSAGSHSVTVEDDNGCTESFSITVNEPSEITGTIVSTDDEGNCEGSLTVTASGGTPTYSYAWDSNAGSGTTETADNLCAGNYCVTITDDNGCTTDVCDDVTSVASTEGFELIDLSVYPNPSTGSINIDFEKEVADKVSLRITDLSGKVIRTEALNRPSNRIDGLISGVYLLYFNSEITQKVKKLIVH